MISKLYCITVYTIRKEMCTKIILVASLVSYLDYILNVWPMNLSWLAMSSAKVMDVM